MTIRSESISQPASAGFFIPVWMQRTDRARTALLLAYLPSMSNFDPLDLQSQERVQVEATERAVLLAQIEVDDLKWVMGNKKGRRFVFRLLQSAGIWRLSFNTNALAMAFAEGTRNEGLRLLAQINTHCPDRYFEMVKESKE